ncbi:TIGR04222 domain-containing membrane protein [Nocardia cyriacigeorgica]|uniref:TIGR04222 domain-containing membrane protein n=1 Tax=Nocardia cyriacigeorgica TaxID=135487 RepID=A0A6P1DB99_9NOCA|nr:TIGR04222 domain-containing membrane protein [Nocardia cyriacigeorgica]NEW38563.1 TIGR04222 domain-containing membrane protein [Nocardia cyriacigeorgica]NEW46120.1 TIGR04222 domain-containing membrane protein [Nocardia cyriacigeorgica]NEW58637.1 TIGR04222 domain-containing membrane protein [Nocardia cyriacigeorgica]
MTQTQRFAPEVIAAGETWGISGGDFLLVYIPVALLAIAAGLYLQRKYTYRRASEWDGVSLEKLTAPETAMLFGEERAVTTAVTLLRSHDIIDSEGTPTRLPTAADRAQLDWFTLAIYDAISHKKETIADITREAAVPLGQLRTALVERGYITGDVDRRDARDAGMPILIVGVLGLVRFIAGIIAGNPSGFLVPCLLVLAFTAWWVMTPDPLTPRGEAAKARAISDNSHLRPSNSPAYTTYGVGAAAVAVAVFGVAALTVLDPGLAQAVQPPTGGADGGGSGGDGGGDGGGCGGGGCGGCGGCGG